MSADSSFEVQAGARLWLLSYLPLADLIAGRLYDRAPDNCPTPYVQFGGDEVMPLRAQGMNGSELYITIHTWADSQTASAEVKKMNKAIRDRMDREMFPDAFPVQGHVIQALFYVRTRTIGDPDPIVRHGVIEFRCFTLPVG